MVSTRLVERTPMPRIDEKVVEILSPGQIKSLFLACEKEYAPILAERDRAILSVLLDTGIRASELTGLTLANTHLQPQDGYLKVLGKGRKEREVGLGTKARSSLYRYIHRFRRASEKEQHVFLSRFQRPLTINGLNQILYRLRRNAHLGNIRCSAHVFRHTYAVSYLKAGGDLFKLSRLMGHSSVSITEMYLKALKQMDARAGGPSVLDNL